MIDIFIQSIYPFVFHQQTIQNQTHQYLQVDASGYSPLVQLKTPFLLQYDIISLFVLYGLFSI